MIVDFVPPHAVADARVASRALQAHVNSSWVTIEGVHRIFGCMMAPQFSALDDYDQKTPPLLWSSGGRACDDKLAGRFFARDGKVVPFGRLTGSFLLALQQCCEVNGETVKRVCFMPDKTLSSAADVNSFLSKMFQGSGRPPAHYPEDARRLWGVLRWVLHGLVPHYTFTRFYMERADQNDKVECQLIAWLWEPKA